MKCRGLCHTGVGNRTKRTLMVNHAGASVSVNVRGLNVAGDCQEGNAQHCQHPSGYTLQPCSVGVVRLHRNYPHYIFSFGRNTPKIE
jgi:hypothetical protein